MNLGLLTYWKDLLAISALTKSVQATGHMTDGQLGELIDVVFAHVPAELRAKQTKPEIIEFVDAAEAAWQPNLRLIAAAKALTV